MAIITKFKIWALSPLLHYANRNIPFGCKDEFYKIKNRLLLKYAIFQKYELQHIKKECFNCGGRGIHRSCFKMPETCWNCGGGGVYDEFWTVLQVFDFGKYAFHLPYGKRLTAKPKMPSGINEIEGYVKHKTPKYYIGRECALWLFFIYNRPLFWQELFKAGCCSTRFTPLVVIGTIGFNVRHFIKYEASRKFNRATAYLKSKVQPSAAQTDDELPF